MTPNYVNSDRLPGRLLYRSSTQKVTTAVYLHSERSSVPCVLIRRDFLRTKQ
jgi:hypothetical protein